ncbi:MAG: arginine deiminase-related protein, partial [Polyangiales bacterium]
MHSFARPVRAFAREVSARYADCVRTDLHATIDIEAARRQHAAYVTALRGFGVTVDVLPAEDALPDACFVEDTSVVTGAHALVTIPGAESRRAEVRSMRAALTAHCTLADMAVPATLDGGDVLRVGPR